VWNKSAQTHGVEAAGASWEKLATKKPTRSDSQMGWRKDGLNQRWSNKNEPPASSKLTSVQNMDEDLQ
jgi:hypothetical protein